MKSHNLKHSGLAALALALASIGLMAPGAGAQSAAALDQYRPHPPGNPAPGGPQGGDTNQATGQPPADPGPSGPTTGSSTPQPASSANDTGSTPVTGPTPDSDDSTLPVLDYPATSFVWMVIGLVVLAIAFRAAGLLRDRLRQAG